MNQRNARHIPLLSFPQMTIIGAIINSESDHMKLLYDCVVHHLQ